MIIIVFIAITKQYIAVIVNAWIQNLFIQIITQAIIPPILHVIIHIIMDKWIQTVYQCPVHHLNLRLKDA